MDGSIRFSHVHYRYWNLGLGIYRYQSDTVSFLWAAVANAILSLFTLCRTKLSWEFGLRYRIELTTVVFLLFDPGFDQYQSWVGLRHTVPICKFSTQINTYLSWCSICLFWFPLSTVAVNATPTDSWFRKAHNHSCVYRVFLKVQSIHYGI